MNDPTNHRIIPEELRDIRLYTLEEIVPIVGVTHRTLLTYVTTGRLKATKIGGKWKVTRQVLEDFISGK